MLRVLNGQCKLGDRIVVTVLGQLHEDNCVVTIVVITIVVVMVAASLKLNMSVVTR
jgi:hypothetical protein